MPELGVGGDYEHDIDEGVTFKDDMPPGSQALHDIHDAHQAVKEAAEHHQGRVEHPGVLKHIAKSIDMAEKGMEETRAQHAQHYPDHPQPGEGVEEPAEDVHPLEQEHDYEEEPEEEELEEKHINDEGGSKLRYTPERTGAKGGAGRAKREDSGDNRGMEGELKSMRNSKRNVKSSLRRKSFTDRRAEALKRTNDRLERRLMELLGDL